MLILLTCFVISFISSHSGFNPQFWLAIPIFLVAFWLIIRSFYTIRISVENGNIRYEEKRIYHSSSKIVQRSDLIGVELQTFRNSGSNSNSTTPIRNQISIIHKNKKLSILLFTNSFKSGEAVLRFNQTISGELSQEFRTYLEAYSRFFQLPVISREAGSGEITLRKPEDLDKSIKELRREGKERPRIDFKTPYKGRNLKIFSEFDGTKIIFNMQKKTTIIAIVIWTIVAVVFFLVNKEYRFLPLVFGSMGLIIFVVGNIKQTLTVGRTDIIFVQESLFQFFRIETNMLLSEIEEVKIGTDPILSSARTVAIISDRSVINFGRGIENEELEWVKNFMLSSIK